MSLARFPHILTPPSRPFTPRRATRALVVLAALLLSLVAAGPSLASACGDKVINDWWDGRIDGTYPLPCYDDAIEQLPRDMRDYSSAPDDIKRAMQAAMRGEQAPPNKEPVRTTERPPNPTETTPPVTTDDQTPTETVAVDNTGSSPSSVPVPLLILGGLALLLVAGGSAGYIVRRLQARRPPPPAI